MKDFPSYLENLKTLISFKSVLGTPQQNAPFGRAIKDTLDFFLSLAKSFGFDVIDYDGYAGEVIFGTGEQEIGIIGHLDVVPTGIGWNSDPFTLTERDGVYYGRGLSDDKTPLLSCLYAMKELKDENFLPNKKIRLILGCDEESGWRDLDYINTKTALPEYGFSPDGNFPLSFAEKGITEVEFSFPKLKNFHSLTGGTVVNAVCDYASAVQTSPIDKALITKHGLTANENGLIESRGKSAHGSTPELGKNALKPLFEYFLDTGEDVKAVIDYLFLDKAKVGEIKTEQGLVTLSPDLICQKDDKIYITCDCRIPAPLSIDDLMPLFNGFGLTVNTKTRHPAVMVEKDGWFVQTLLGAYNDITGENATPISIGGSTFSRAFRKGCAFGPHFNGHEDNIHDANENVSKEQILRAFDIYKSAIKGLCK